MHRQASELKIHEEQDEDDDELEDEARSHKISKASPEMNKKFNINSENKSPEINLKKIEENQMIERPTNQMSKRKSADTEIK